MPGRCRIELERWLCVGFVSTRLLSPTGRFVPSLLLGLCTGLRGCLFGSIRETLLFSVGDRVVNGGNDKNAPTPSSLWSTVVAGEEENDPQEQRRVILLFRSQTYC